jgi:hypothetical protein
MRSFGTLLDRSYSLIGACPTPVVGDIVMGPQLVYFGLTASEGYKGLRGAAFPERTVSGVLMVHAELLALGIPLNPKRARREARRFDL